MQMTKRFFAIFGAVFALAGVTIAGPAWAAKPEPWQYGFQEPATPIMEMVVGFHDLLLIIITAITVFVTALLVWVMIRYNAKANPNPKKFSHNTMIEVIWTAVPVAILIVIAIPSFRLLYAVEKLPEADITVKAVGQTWYWDYVYQEAREDGSPIYDFEFSSFMVPDEDIQGDQIRLLSTDNAMVVPVGATVRVLITSDINGVLHSWTVPAFGIKMDAVPGRLNETWFRAEREGTFYGQCSELCGVGHAYMPIEVRVVSQEEYAAWTQDMQVEFARTELEGGVQVADVKALLNTETELAAR